MFRFHNAPFVCFPFAHLGRPCLASRMERAVIPIHYWRDKQSLSSSFLDPGRNLLVKIVCSIHCPYDLLIFRCGGCLSDSLSGLGLFCFHGFSLSLSICRPGNIIFTKTSPVIIFLKKIVSS